MFENSGEKIKIIAIVLFWITVVASVILAFVFGWSEEYSYYYGRYERDVSFEPFYFFAFLIGGPLCSYISTLLLVAFSDLVQNSQRIKEVTKEITKEMKNSKTVESK